MNATRPAIRSLAAFFIKRRLGRELLSVWIALSLAAIYLLLLSPFYQNEPRARLLIFNPLPWALFPFLFAENDFDRHGWIRSWLSARSDRRNLFVAHAIGRLGIALINGVVVSAVLIVVGWDPEHPESAFLIFLGTTSFALYMVGVSSAIGQFVSGRLGIVANYACVLVLAYLVVKVPSSLYSWASFALFPAGLAGLETAQLWLSSAPWQAVAGITASIVWWAISYKSFLRNTAS